MASAVPGDWITPMGAGIIYPQTVSFPAVQLGLAPPNATSAPPIAIAHGVGWADASGHTRTLYTAPPGWIVLQVVSDGPWGVASAGPVMPDYRFAAASATSPWTLTAFDAAGRTIPLARSSGGTAMHPNPPPAMVLQGDVVAWTNPGVPAPTGALVSEANLATGSRRVVRVTVPDGVIIDGLVAAQPGPEGWPTPIFTVHSPEMLGGVLCAGAPAAKPSLWALTGLPDGTALVADRVTLYAGPPCGPWSRVASLDGPPERAWIGPDPSTWVDIDQGRGRELLQLGSDGRPAALYRVPPGVNVAGDVQGLAWYRVARTPAGAKEWSIWWTEGAL